MGNFSVTEFKSAVAKAGGLTRGNFYRCVIGGDNNIDRTLLCKAVEMPAIAVTPVELRYFTRPIKIPGAREYGPLTLTFFNTANYVTRNFFEVWHGTLSSYQSNARNVLDVPLPGASTKSYRADSSLAYRTVELIPLNAAGDVLTRYTFRNAWPSNISSMPFSYESDAEAQTYTVQFEYMDMINVETVLPTYSNAEIESYHDTTLFFLELLKTAPASVKDTIEWKQAFGKWASNPLYNNAGSSSRWTGAAISVLSLFVDSVLDGRVKNDKAAWDALFRRITAPDPSPSHGGTGGNRRIDSPLPK